MSRTLSRRITARSSWQPWFATLARVVLAAVFAAAGYAKVVDVNESIRAVRAYDLLPEGVVQVVGPGLPLLELALALALFVGVATRLGGVIASFLLVMFIIGVGSAWARGLTIDCGCFGGGGTVAAADTRYLQEILRDLGLLALALFLTWRPFSRLSVDALVHGDDLPDHHDLSTADAAPTQENLR